MKQQLYNPKGLLSDYVEFFWYDDGYQPTSRMERVLPAGSSQIIINLGEKRFRHFSKTNHNLSYEYEETILAGIHTNYLYLDSHTRLTTMGIVLNHGAISALFNIPADEFRNQIVPLAEICNSDTSELKPKLMASPGVQQKFGILESFLLSLLDTDCLSYPVTKFATDQICRHDGDISISKILNQTGYSKRWFCELFRKNVGVTPKQFARIHRFQRVLSILRQKNSLQWTDIALECGYFDQAHLIHDFKAIAGITPFEYQRNCGDVVNHLPV